MEIEYNYRNLLLPVGGEFVAYRQRASYIFTIYRADGLPDMSSFCMKNDYENINPFVQISFAGMKVNWIHLHTFPFEVNLLSIQYLIFLANDKGGVANLQTILQSEDHIQ